MGAPGWVLTDNGATCGRDISLLSTNPIRRCKCLCQIRIARATPIRSVRLVVQVYIVDFTRDQLLLEDCMSLKHTHRLQHSETCYELLLFRVASDIIAESITSHLSQIKIKLFSNLLALLNLDNLDKDRQSGKKRMPDT